MIDYFSLLGERRRPWLDPERLKRKFLELSAEVHPDRVHALGASERAAAQEKYMALNTAHQCLREPRDRIRHLLELERGAAPKGVQEIPADLMEFAMRVAGACREAEKVSAENAATLSPLLKVEYFERSQISIEKLQELLRALMQRRERLLTELRRIDEAWSKPVGGSAEGDDQALICLEEMLPLFAYFDRWIAQIQERIVRLSV